MIEYNENYVVDGDVSSTRTFIINGTGGSGKDAFVKMVREFFIKYEFRDTIANISSVEEIKEIATEFFGYNGEKTPEWRKALSDLKDIQTKMCNGPLNFMMDEWKHHGSYGATCFFHIREPEEIEKFKQATGASTILIKRPFCKTIGNHADENVENYEYDITIHNDGDLENLYDIAFEFCNENWAKHFGGYEDLICDKEY